ncbi:hypothetical protein HYY69_02085 [Candidatus Woesearchaeota archaeon]|nr:hypothetical protein [Candidatus Woesearchaeota archaeon]
MAKHSRYFLVYGLLFSLLMILMSGVVFAQPKSCKDTDAGAFDFDHKGTVTGMNGQSFTDYCGDGNTRTKLFQGAYVVEHYCNNIGKVVSSMKRCDHMCKGGACITPPGKKSSQKTGSMITGYVVGDNPMTNPTTLVCIDSDNGADPYVYGTLTYKNPKTGQVLTKSDSCAIQSLGIISKKESCSGEKCIVEDSTCSVISPDNIVIDNKEIPCPQGCSKGVCAKPEQGPASEKSDYGEPQGEVSCTDSDGGIFLTKKGKGKGFNYNKVVELEDSCEGNEVKEVYCDKLPQPKNIIVDGVYTTVTTQLTTSIKKCAGAENGKLIDGMVCYQGACVDPASISNKPAVQPAKQGDNGKAIGKTAKKQCAENRDCPQGQVCSENKVCVGKGTTKAPGQEDKSKSSSTTEAEPETSTTTVVGSGASGQAGKSSPGSSSKTPPKASSGASTTLKLDPQLIKQYKYNSKNLDITKLVLPKLVANQQKDTYVTECVAKNKKQQLPVTESYLTLFCSCLYDHQTDVSACLPYLFGMNPQGESAVEEKPLDKEKSSDNYVVCVDSDGGKNTLVEGTTKGMDLWNKDKFIIGVDSCNPAEDQIVEYVCEKDKIDGKEYAAHYWVECPEGTTLNCNKHVCVKPSSTPTTPEKTPDTTGKKSPVGKTSKKQCTEDRDCPQGQVCSQNKVCVGKGTTKAPGKQDLPSTEKTGDKTGDKAGTGDKESSTSLTSCQDSDNSQPQTYGTDPSFFVKGTVTSNQGTKEDYCQTLSSGKTYLFEGWCKNNKYDYSQVNCANFGNDYICDTKAGACVKAPTCTDSDVAAKNDDNQPLFAHTYFNIKQKGTAYGLYTDPKTKVQSITSKEDYCEGTSLVEFACNVKENKIEWDGSKCPEETVCDNGACVSVVSSTTEDTSGDTETTQPQGVPTPEDQLEKDLEKFNEPKTKPLPEDTSLGTVGKDGTRKTPESTPGKKEYIKECMAKNSLKVPAGLLRNFCSCMFDNNGNIELCKRELGLKGDKETTKKDQPSKMKPAYDETKKEPASPAVPPTASRDLTVKKPIAPNIPVAPVPSVGETESKTAKKPTMRLGSEDGKKKPQPGKPTGKPCSNDADCGVGQTCNAAVGQCVTASPAIGGGEETTEKDTGATDHGKQPKLLPAFDVNKLPPAVRKNLENHRNKWFKQGTTSRNKSDQNAENACVDRLKKNKKLVMQFNDKQIQRACDCLAKGKSVSDCLGKLTDKKIQPPQVKEEAEKELAEAEKQIDQQEQQAENSFVNGCVAGVKGIKEFADFTEASIDKYCACLFHQGKECLSMLEKYATE